MNSNSNIIFGRHPVEDAIRSGTPVDKVFIQEGIRGELEKTLRHLCKEHRIALQVIPKERLNHLVRGNHQGVAAFLAAVQTYQLEDVVPGIFERGESPLILILEGVTDVRNFGAIARSAEVLGAHTIVIPTKNSAQINAEAVKASAGALLKIPVCRSHSLVKVVEYLKLSGIKILASDLRSNQTITKLDLTMPLALVIGSEGEGISESLLRLADERFVIPQRGTVDSLNVSVATGIMLYEVVRQRN